MVDRHGGARAADRRDVAVPAAVRRRAVARGRTAARRGLPADGGAAARRPTRAEERTMSSAPLREHAFDGIREFDNRLPNWWLWTFYSACLFSVGYWILHHTLGIADLPAAAYLQEQRDAAARIEAQLAQNPVTEELLLKLAGEPAIVEKGA